MMVLGPAQNGSTLMTGEGGLSGETWFWGAPEWGPIALVMAFVLLGLLMWSYRPSRWRGGWSLVAMVLKAAGLILLLTCLMQPMRRASRPRPQANVLAMVVDNSYSMNVRQSDSRTLAEAFSSQINEPSSWKTRLLQDFDVRTFQFGARLLATDQLDALPFDAGVSSLNRSMKELAARFADRPVAGAILWSDGNDTTTRDLADDSIELPFPIFPVVTNGNDLIRDVRIDQVTVTESEFETAPMTVRATIRSTDPNAADYRVRWLGPDAKIVDEASVRCELSQSAEVEFRFRPETSDVQFYQMIVCRDDQAMSPADWIAGKFPDATDETIWDNNRAVVTVDRRGGPFRVLYVAGRPNWEFKFLQRAMATDAEVQLVGLIRIAEKEPKFSFRDASVDSTNPLFAGLDDDEMELREQIDEPVILRLGVRDSEELSAGFPKTMEELFGYDAVMLDDLDESFFTEDQMVHLRRFVVDRGGGVMFLGGQESFGRSLARTPLADLLPVYAATEDSASSEPSSVAYSREGVLQPWLRLRRTEVAELERMESMPMLTTINAVGRVKPGGSRLLEWTSPGGQTMAAMATQRLGRGRTAALSIGDLWRYQMRVSDEDQDDPRQWWRQMTRWLMSEVPRRVEMSVRPDENSNSDDPAVVISIRVADEEFNPVENAGVELQVVDGDGEVQPLSVRPSETEFGLYQSTFQSGLPGAYRFVARVEMPDGRFAGEVQRGWVADPRSNELKQLAVDRERLQAIADRSGGRLIPIDTLDDFVTELSTRPVPVMQTWTYPLWHGPWILMAAITCLAGEWGIRRWKGWS